MPAYRLFRTLTGTVRANNSEHSNIHLAVATWPVRYYRPQNTDSYHKSTNLGGPHPVTVGPQHGTRLLVNLKHRTVSAQGCLSPSNTGMSPHKAACHPQTPECLRTRLLVTLKHRNVSAQGCLSPSNTGLSPHNAACHHQTPDCLRTMLLVTLKHRTVSAQCCLSPSNTGLSPHNRCSRTFMLTITRHRADLLEKLTVVHLATTFQVFTNPTLHLRVHKRLPVAPNHTYNNLVHFCSLSCQLHARPTSS